MFIVLQLKQRRGNLLSKNIPYSYRIGQEVSTTHASVGGHRSSQGNGKRRAVMVECDWEACGPITHMFKIVKIVEAAVFPRSEKVMVSVEWPHQQ